MDNIKSIELTIDVFGFSRGAAAARNFIYEINYANKRKEDTIIEQKAEKIGKKTIQKIDLCGNILYETVDEYAFSYYDKDKNLLNEDLLIEGKMPKLGYLGYYLLEKGLSKEELDIIKLNIRFIGIYDTVSSYEEFGNISGLNLLKKGIQHSKKSFFEDDEEQLQLNNLGEFGKAVHFTAMNEHRENFALTKMRVGNCIEKTFPGVHCDIGGAYETGTEYVDEIETSFLPILKNSILENYKQKLISDYWYKEDQLSISNETTKTAFGTKKNFPLFYKKLSGTRFLRKEYSYIPLHFMEEFFDTTLKDDSNNKIIVIKGEGVISEYSIENYLEEDQRDTLNKAKERLRTYVFRDEKKAEEDRSEKEKEWTFISDEEIKKTFGEEKGIDIIKNDTLRKLRNKYLHWSANRDWFGMDPTSDRIRKEY